MMNQSQPSNELQTTVDQDSNPTIPTPFTFWFVDQPIQSQNLPNNKCRYCRGAGVVGAIQKHEPSKDPNQPNGLCFCGSGTKYKKCHMKMINKMNRMSKTIVICHCVGYAKLGPSNRALEMKSELESFIGPPSDETRILPKTLPVDGTLV